MLYIFDIISNMKKYISIFFALMLGIFTLFCPQNKGVNCFADEVTNLGYSFENISNYYSISKYSKTIYLTSESKIAKIDNQVAYFDNSDTATGIYKPQFAMQVDDEVVAVFDSLNGIQIYNCNFEHKATYRIVESLQNTKYSLGKVSSVAKDYLGNLYFIDYTNNKILCLAQNATAITEVYVDSLDTTFNKESQIAINPNGDIIAISNSDSIYVCNLQQNKIIAQFNAKASKIMFDYASNLFLQNQNNILKYDNQNYQNTDSKQINITPTDITLDVETGMFYILLDNIYTYYSNGFALNPSDEVAPVTPNTTTLLSDVVTMAKVTTKTKLYSTCVSFASSDDVEVNSQLIILSKDVVQNRNMCYCLLIIDGVQKQGYIEKVALQTQQVVIPEQTYKTICPKVQVQTYPVSTSGLYSDAETNTPIYLDEQTEIKVISDLQNFTDASGNTYYAVKIGQNDEFVGYINQNYLAPTNQFESQKVDITPYSDRQTEFIAYILTVVVLLGVTIAVCVYIAKKQ